MTTRPVPSYLRLFVAVMTCIWLVFPLAANAATLTELQSQLKKAQDELAKYEELQKKEKDKINTYSDQIQKTQAQINQVKQNITSLESNIADKESDIAATNQKIETKAHEIGDMTENLNASLATVYELSNYADYEVLRGPVSRYSDQNEYLYSLQDRIVNDIDSLNKVKSDLEATKKQLEDKRTELARLKGQQEAKNQQLAEVKEEKTELLNKSKLTEAQYRDAINKLEKEKDQISSDIYELRKRLSRQSKEVYLSATSGYPFSAINKPDPWLFLTRQCTSYAAWKWNVVYGRPWDNTRPGQGSAYNWPNLARDQGYNVVSTPRVGAIVSWARGPAMPYGHVAIVEGVNGDGTINVSEYNWNQYAFSRRDNVRYQDYGTASFIVP